MKQVIRVGILGNNYVIKVKTTGLYAHGWRVFEKDFKKREEATARLRLLISTGHYEEG